MLNVLIYNYKCNINLLKTLFSIKDKQGLKHKIDIIKEERDIETRTLVE